MTNKEIHDLIKLVNRLDLSEFKLRDGDFEMSIRTKLYGKRSKPEGQSIPVMAMSAAQAVHPLAAMQPEVTALSTADSTTAADSGEEESGLVEVKSPIVGIQVFTFFLICHLFSLCKRCANWKKQKNTK